MIVYLDASALVKRYVIEPFSSEVTALTAEADSVATSLITRAEVAAAFARAVRMGILDDAGARRALRTFGREWPDLVRIPVVETLISRAENSAWQHGLRGYDAVQLASALTWHESISQPVRLATFDHELWAAAGRVGLDAWPERFPGA